MLGDWAFWTVTVTTLAALLGGSVCEGYTTDVVTEPGKDDAALVDGDEYIAGSGVTLATFGGGLWLVEQNVVDVNVTAPGSVPDVLGAELGTGTVVASTRLVDTPDIDGVSHLREIKRER